MYQIRRGYRTKPGEAPKVAKLVYKQAKVVQAAGQRGEFTVSYNGYTLPGETNIVILEWCDDQIMSPTRPGNHLPPDVFVIAREYSELIENQHIEFYEMLDPSTMED